MGIDKSTSRHQRKTITIMFLLVVVLQYHHVNDFPQKAVVVHCHLIVEIVINTNQSVKNQKLIHRIEGEFFYMIM